MEKCLPRKSNGIVSIESIRLKCVDVLGTNGIPKTRLYARHYLNRRRAFPPCFKETLCFCSDFQQADVEHIHVIRFTPMTRWLTSSYRTNFRIHFTRDVDLYFCHLISSKVWTGPILRDTRRPQLSGVLRCWNTIVSDMMWSQLVSKTIPRTNSRCEFYQSIQMFLVLPASMS